jgi:peptidoglycan/xylan/chitin deacetylase (PgdA/CDA1 family)
MSLPVIHPSARRSPRTLFLVWHDIVPREKLVWFDTTLAEFQAQLTALEKAKVHPTALPQVETWLTTGQNPPPPKSVVLCFDDNTQGIFDFALPELKRRGWPFVVSAHTAFVGVKTGKAHNDWAALKQLVQGGATLVSQTHSHPPDLRTFTDPKLAKEFALSKASMAKHLGITPRYVTYPSGKWDARVAEAAQAAGYTLGLTEDFGWAESSPHRLGIFRYSTHRRWGEALKALTTR